MILLINSNSIVTKNIVLCVISQSFFFFPDLEKSALFPKLSPQFSDPSGSLCFPPLADLCPIINVVITELT